MTIHKPLAFLGFLAALVIGASECHAWSESDTAREVTWQVVNAIDLGQTLDIARNCDTYYEMNPIIGECPDKNLTVKYFIAAAVSHYGISLALPGHFRKKWQIGTIVISGMFVLNNHRLGLRVTF